MRRSALRQYGGLTMIELLVALAMLAVVMVAVISWIGVSTEAAATVLPKVRRHAAHDAVGQLINDDVLTGDFLPGTDAPRVEVTDGVLRIRTRGMTTDGPVGPVVHEYLFDAPAGELRRRERKAQGQSRTRVLLDGVDDFQCAIDETGRYLTVSIRSREGSTLVRRFDIR